MNTHSMKNEILKYTECEVQWETHKKIFLRLKDVDQSDTVITDAWVENIERALLERREHRRAAMFL